MLRRLSTLVDDLLDEISCEHPSSLSLCEIICSGLRERVQEEGVEAKTSRRGGNGTWRRATFWTLPHVILVVFCRGRWQACGKWRILSLCTCGKRGHFLGESSRTHSENHVGLALFTRCPGETFRACAPHLDRIDGRDCRRRRKRDATANCGYVDE